MGAEAEHQSRRLPLVPKEEAEAPCENRPIAKRASGRWAVPGGCREAGVWSDPGIAPQTEILILSAGDSFLVPAEAGYVLEHQQVVRIMRYGKCVGNPPGTGHDRRPGA